MSVSVWSIPSNSGWSLIRFEAQVLHQPTNQLEHAIELVGQFWYRPELWADPPEYNQRIDDYRFLLPSVLISKRACYSLLSDFDRWLASHEPFSSILTSGSDQLAMIEVGDRNGIRRLDTPRLTFCYKAPGCRLKVFYSVDHSCIRQATAELGRILRSFDENSSTPAP